MIKNIWGQVHFHEIVKHKRHLVSHSVFEHKGNKSNYLTNLYAVYDLYGNTSLLREFWILNHFFYFSGLCIVHAVHTIGFFSLKTFWKIHREECTGVNDKTDNGWIPFSCFSFRVLVMCSLSCLAGTLEKNRAKVNGVRITCAFPTLTRSNVLLLKLHSIPRDV